MYPLQFPKLGFFFVPKLAPPTKATRPLANKMASQFEAKIQAQQSVAAAPTPVAAAPTAKKWPPAAESKASEPAAAPAPQPLAQPVPQPVAQPVAHPVVQPVAQPIVQPVAQLEEEPEEQWEEEEATPALDQVDEGRAWPSVGSRIHSLSFVNTRIAPACRF